MSSNTNGPRGSLPELDLIEFKNVIDGKLVDTQTHRHGINPATGEAGPDVPVSSQDDLDEAVRTARTAYKSWSKVPFEERRAAVLAYADALERYKDAFTHLITKEQGMPLAQAAHEVAAAIGNLHGLASLNVESEVIEDDENRKITVRYTPLGVVGAIVPWNFPVVLAIGKICPAVLMGNSVIVKPSPYTPYSGLKICELAQHFFPPGVISALSGDDALGPLITSHPGIDKITFTGSTATGKLVAASAAKTLKRLTLELGGNDPAIICEDVDIQKVAPQVAMLSFMNSGQVCLAIKRVYVHESIYVAFREVMVAFTKGLKVGEGTGEGVTLGPIQNLMQYDRVKGFLKDIDSEGWNVAVGEKLEDKGKGYFISPMIIDNPSDDSKIVREEPFGPIVPLLSWSSEEEVIERANATDMGLGASVWSKDTDRAHRIAEQLEAGSVFVNSHFNMSPKAPFGGHKQSGIGVESGVAGLKSMCNTQALIEAKNAA